MLNRPTISTIALIVALTFSPLVFAQGGQPQQAGKASGAAKDKTAAAPSGPAPVHDISGTWEPANGPGDGIQANGVKAMPNDGKPEHQLPFTPYGLQEFKSHKALEGPSGSPGVS